MRSLQEIRNILVDHKSRLFHNYPIKSMAIFGSFVHGDQKDGSDLDILVEFSDKIGIRFVDLADELESIVGFKVDLISKKGIKEKYLKAIDQDLVYV
jgi:hypothetical protein